MPLNVIAALLLRLSRKYVVIPAFVVRVPVAKFFPAIVTEPSPPNTRDGVILEVIVLCKVKFPFIVSV